MVTETRPVENPKKETHRVLQLDILRGLAILLVLGRHFPIKASQAGIFKPFAGLWMRIGWTGVDLFFVLSGFLVGGLLFKELRTRGSLDVRRFIIRRGFKIWPSYYLCLAVVCVVVFVESGYHLGESFRLLLPNFLHLQNYFLQPDSLVWNNAGHTWSLAVEEHFYLALPLLLLFLVARGKANRNTIPATPYIAVGLMVFCTGLRCLLLWRVSHYGTPEALDHFLKTYNLLTHLRIDSLFFGVFLAFLYHYRPETLQRLTQRRNLLLLVGVLLLLPVLPVDKSKGSAAFLTAISFTSLYIGYGCILLALIYTPLGSGRLGRWMDSAAIRFVAWIGYYSYTIYLWHVLFAVKPTENLVARGVHFGPPTINWLLTLSLYLTLAIGAGILGGILIDKPTLVLRDKLFPARSDALKSTPAENTTGHE